MNKNYTIKFKCGGEVFTCNEKENDFYRLDIENGEGKYKVTIIPKKNQK